MTSIRKRMATFRFGVFDVDFGTGELRRRGLRVRLQEQPLRVLSALLERPGELVTREELSRRLWPEGTFVDFEHGVNAAVRRLRIALGDEAEVPRFVETVHKRGYRFIGLGNGAWRSASASRHGAPATIAHIGKARTRLAVLPFGPCDGFTDGLTEEAMIHLTQCCPRSIGVIARTSVEKARREGGNVAEIGRALSADYLVDGHVRREGERVRITAQLIEAQEETHLWASTFDRVLTDPLTVQSEVGEEIAKAVTEALASNGAGPSLQL